MVEGGGVMAELGQVNRSLCWTDVAAGRVVSAASIGELGGPGGVTGRQWGCAAYEGLLGQPMDQQQR